MGWLKLIKGYPLSLLPTILVLFLPGYAIITSIWPSDEKMGRTLRGGLGFVLGLFFILFLPLILNNLKLTYLTDNLNQILLILTIFFSLVAMSRRKEPMDKIESPQDDAQLTLEESIERAALMRQKAEQEEYGDYYDEEYKGEYFEEKHPEDEITKVPENGEEASGSQDLKKEKPLQYERLKDRYSIDGENHQDLPDKRPIPKEVPLRVEEPVKTSPFDYEAEMDKPVWSEEPEEKKPGFKNWDLVMILFLSGVSLLFLYFNPLKTTTTSIIFFILLLFILGYAGLTIVYPDKSRVSTGKLILATSVIAIILFMVSFLVCWMHLLPAIPKYLVQIMFVASVIMSAVAFIRKWRATHGVTSVEDDKDITREEIYVEDIPEEETVPEEVPVEEPMVTGETTKPEAEVSAKKDPLTILKSMGKTTQTSEIIAKKDIHTEYPHTQPRNHYLDIILMVALTLLTAAFILIKPLNQTFIRTILGILLVLFIPGYSLIAALFPKWGDLDGIERAALSFGLSIAVTPLIGLALNYTPWGIRLDPLLISLTMFTLTMCLIASLRRRKLPEKERYFVPFGQFVKDIRKSFQGESKNEKILSIILIISIILAISTTAYIIVKPKQGEKFTEFYILGPDGKASNYPTNLTTGQNGSLTIGVVNHEYATTDYLLLVKVNSSILHNQTITLTSGQKMEIPFSFTAGSTGQKKLEFLLYKLPDNDTAYRSLHLWLNVR